MRKLANMPTTKQFAKFAVVGFASLAVDYALLLVLVEWMHIDLLFSTTVSFIASVIVNYALSMRFVFEHKEDMSRKREFTIFAILSAIGLGLNDLYMFVGVAVFNIGYQFMKLVSTFLVTWYNYFSRRQLTIWQIRALRKAPQGVFVYARSTRTQKNKEQRKWRTRHPCPSTT